MQTETYMYTLFGEVAAGLIQSELIKNDKDGRGLSEMLYSFHLLD